MAPRLAPGIGLIADHHHLDIDTTICLDDFVMLRKQFVLFVQSL